MKPLYTFIVGLLVAGLFAFTHLQTTYDARKSTAEVEQMQGFFVFVNCTPVLEYEYLGTEKPGLTWDDDFVSVRDKMLKKCRKSFPEADGLIFHLSSNSNRCDAIKFKPAKKE